MADQSGSRRVFRHLPPPKNRTGDFRLIRLKPFKGTGEGARSWDFEPLPMDLPMTNRMKQNEIIDPVRATVGFPDHMMHMPSALYVEPLTTCRASSRLLPPQLHQAASEDLAHEALLAFLKVAFPPWIERIGSRFDLDVSPDRDGSQ